MKARKVLESKTRTVKELEDLIKGKKTILIASIKNIPASQFQEIMKKLRGKAIVKVPKKNLIFRALDSSDEAVKKLGKDGKPLPHSPQMSQMKEQIGDSVAILFSDMDCFELSEELLRNTSPAKAKPGQEAPEDIEIEEGGTDLVPGPAVSELGALGIQIKIEKGKIHIKSPKVIAKKGEKISRGAAELMGKLDIKPFNVGFIPLSAFNTQENKLYLEIKIDKQGTLNELKASYSKALALAVEIGYANDETIKFLISKAGQEGKAIEKIANAKASRDEKIDDKIDDAQSNSDKQNIKNDSQITDSNQSSEPETSEQIKSEPQGEAKLNEEKKEDE